jgi:hypothetical protein
MHFPIQSSGIIRRTIGCSGRHWTVSASPSEKGKSLGLPVGESRLRQDHHGARCHPPLRADLRINEDRGHELAHLSSKEMMVFLPLPAR